MFSHVDRNYEIEHFFNCLVFSLFCGKTLTLNFGFEDEVDPLLAYFVFFRPWCFNRMLPLNILYSFYDFRFGAINM